MKKILLEATLIFAGLGVAASLLAGLEGRTQTESLTIEAKHLKGVPQQKASEMRTLESRRLFALDQPGEPLWGPFKFRLDPEGRPMVIDFGDSTIKLLSRQGELLETLGEGKGQGPGEFQSITDVAASGDDVWVVDSSNSRITVFGRDGSIQRTLNLTTPPYRIAVLSESRFTVLHSLNQLEAFGVYSRDGVQEETFGRFNEKPWDGIAFEGKIARGADGSFAFYGTYWGYFARYDASGQLLYARETLQPTPIPNLSRRNGVVRVADGSGLSALSTSIDGDNLYLLRGTQVGNRLSEQVDVYAIANGEYRYSFQIPKPSSNAFFHGEEMYLGDGVSLTKWSFRVL